MSNRPLYIGAAFFGLGANIIFRDIRFLLHGKVMRGRVKAIEKYISITKDADNSRYMIPWIEDVQLFVVFTWNILAPRMGLILRGNCGISSRLWQVDDNS